MIWACAGALAGAILMFLAASFKLVEGFRTLIGKGAASGEIVAAVMGATDSFLFGVVLIIFAYSIAFGFVVEVTDELHAHLPEWMHPKGVSELKHTLIEVIIVYLVVDFATDLSESGGQLSWTTLVKPLAIALIAAALRLMPASKDN